MERENWSLETLYEDHGISIGQSRGGPWEQVRLSHDRKMRLFHVAGFNLHCLEERFGLEGADYSAILTLGELEDFADALNGIVADARGRRAPP